MPEPTGFQDAFCEALTQDLAALSPWMANGDGPARLSVYRNSVAKSSADALAATFATVVQLVGEDWFAAAAVAFSQCHPPQTPSLLGYGAGFADWLASFPPAQDAPYLAGIARLDWLWQEAYFAADADTLSSGLELAAADLARQRARLHPSVRLVAFDDNIVSLWLAHRSADALRGGFELLARPERALVHRTALAVEIRPLEAATFAFLESCQEGESLVDCAQRALAADPRADLGEIVGQALELGLICEVVAL